MSGKDPTLANMIAAIASRQLATPNMVCIESEWKQAMVQSPTQPSPWHGFPGGYDNWRARRDHYEKLKYRRSSVRFYGG